MLGISLHKHIHTAMLSFVPRRRDGVMQNQSQTIYEIPAVVEDGEREGIAAEFMGVHLFMCVPD